MAEATWPAELGGTASPPPLPPPAPALVAVPAPAPVAGMEDAARRYGQAALRSETAVVRQTTEGSRNQQINKSAFGMGQLVPGGFLTVEEIEPEIRAAARATGLPEWEINTILPRAIYDGMKEPRQVDLKVAHEPVVFDLAVEAAPEPRRRVTLTCAAGIRLRRAQWLWKDRLAVGALALLAGREGIGKSTLAYWLAAEITRGLLPGEFHGRPRGVLICATEDSWEHTIVPRLVAADADLSRVFRVEVVTADGIHSDLDLPTDLKQTEEAAEQVDAALLLLDPLMSRLSSGLDTHRDSEVRRALEPLVALADRVGMAVLGLIHHNKSGSTDPLQLVMGSKAFTAVARSVHTVIVDADDETEERRLFGTPKNNLGRSDLPTLAFVIASHAVETDDGLTFTGRLEWVGESTATIGESMRRASETDEQTTAVGEAARWLTRYLASVGGGAPSADALDAGGTAGHSASALKRGRARAGITAESTGSYPRTTLWVLSSGQSDHQSVHQSGHHA